MHMMKEEMVLFPYMVRMEEAVIEHEPILPPPFGSVQNPVSMMEHEHDSAGNALRAMRHASAEYTPPADACISYQTLYKALAEFEADLHQHIHLENNILFPRAIAMEQRNSPTRNRDFGHRLPLSPLHKVDCRVSVDSRQEPWTNRATASGWRTTVLARTDQVPVRLSGSHRRSWLCAGDCSGRLRTSVPDCAWAQSLGVSLRPYLWCAMRSGLPQGNH